MPTELTERFQAFREEFIEHRSDSRAGHVAIKEDVDELRGEIKDFKTEVSKEFDEVGQRFDAMNGRIDTLTNSLNEVKIQMASAWTLRIPKDAKSILLILAVISTLLGIPIATTVPAIAENIPAIVDHLPIEQLP